MSGTAEVHQSTLTPTKLELLAAWLPTQPWFDGDAADLADDPVVGQLLRP